MSSPFLYSYYVRVEEGCYADVRQKKHADKVNE